MTTDSTETTKTTETTETTKTTETRETRETTASATAASRAVTNSSIQLIGQGGFGCVYYRGFDSAGKIVSPTYVTKLAILETSQETEMGKLISHLPGYDAFFNTVVETQPIDLAVLAPETKEQCKVIKRFAEKNPGVEPEFQILKQLYVPHVTLLDFVKRRGIFMDAAQTFHIHAPHRTSRVNRGVNAVTYSVPRFVNTMINCYEHVLMAVARMQAESEVVHYDIKIQNVVLNVYTKTPIILDFGLSFSIRDVRAVLDESGVSDFEKVLRLKTFFYGYHPDYAPWAIETHIISFLVSEAHENARNTDGGGYSSAASPMAVPTLTVENLTEMLTTFVEGSEYLREQPELVKRAYFNRAIRMYTQSAVGKPGMQVIRNYIFGEDGNAWRKWEIYSAATLILDMMEEMNKAYKPVEIEPYKTEIDAFCTSLKIDGNYI
jgi:serine/threonine protein kinase